MQKKGNGIVENWRHGGMDKKAQGQRPSATQTAGKPLGAEAGFTIIELLIAIALGLVILAGLFRTFKVQHDSYVIQDQVSAMQQNLRAAMYMITRDLQMAGYYTNFDRNNRQLNWDDLDGDNENGRPLVFGVNDVTSSTEVRAGTDVITIVKADNDPTASRSVSGTASGAEFSVGWDLDGSNFGLLVKEDLSFADLIVKDGANWKPAGSSSLMENYASGDTVFRTDIIVYRINADAAHPCLERKNLGRGETGYQTIAENIENLQLRYQLNDGTWTTDPGANQSRVRAVEVLLVGRTAYPDRGYIDSSTYSFGEGATAYSYTPPGDDKKYRRKVLTSFVKTRNIGL